jgi:hypothetical protein
MASRPWVYIEVKEHRPALGVAHMQARFFLCFAQCTLARVLIFFNMPTRLQPQIESLVQVQHRCLAADHYTRRRDVGGVCMFVARVGKLNYLMAKSC